ncbi:hypothetical protein IW262DRAFT_1302766 [Armillaria fumosa]|nr:hypothetical protein IW262DRAFT_1302766 [Armillaria fumosa]
MGYNNVLDPSSNDPIQAVHVHPPLDSNSTTSLLSKDHCTMCYPQYTKICNTLLTIRCQKEVGKSVPFHEYDGKACDELKIKISAKNAREVVWAYHEKNPGIGVSEDMHDFMDKDIPHIDNLHAHILELLDKHLEALSEEMKIYGLTKTSNHSWL